MTNLLVVDCDINLKYIIKNELEDTIGGYEVFTASNGLEGLEVWREKKLDVILCDTELPEMNGLDMIAEIRAQDEEVLILFASSNISAKNVMTGYELGGNSYIRKPFMPRELDAHIKALMKLKGSRRVIDDTNLIKFGTYILDIEHCILKNEKTGDVVLTTLESSLLETLCRSMGETVKRVDLLKTFWNAKDDNKYYASRSLDVFITKLRKKILADPNLEIRTQRGVGIGLFLK